MYVIGIKHQINMKSLYLKSDIVILPTWREGLSRVLKQVVWNYR